MTAPLFELLAEPAMDDDDRLEEKLLGEARLDMLVTLERLDRTLEAAWGIENPAPMILSSIIFP